MKERGNIGFQVNEDKTEDKGNTWCTHPSAKIVELAVLS
jgi:hypothetical protein